MTASKRARRCVLIALAAQGGAGCTERDPAGAPRSTDAAGAATRCGGEGQTCCPEPNVPCGVQLTCAPGSRVCALEERPVGTDRLCVSGADCAAEETCCPAGNFGTCSPLDPEACPLPDLELRYDANYMSPAQVGPGFAGRVPPQLSVNRAVFQADAYSDEVDSTSILGTVPAAAAFRNCAVEKQCVGGSGLRTLLGFSINVYNRGDADLILGAVGAPGVKSAACEGPAYYSSSGEPEPFLNPPYRENYLLYQLLDTSMTSVVENYGRAPAICLPAAQSTSRFSCEFLGLPKDSFETYDKSAVCQWLDITGVPPGDYTLRLSVNPGRLLPERSYENNTLDLPVRLPSVDLLAPCPGAMNRLVFSVTSQRDCGWSAQPAVSCTPGTSIDFGCTECSGDAVLRVCEGTAPCTADQALPSTDLLIGNGCPAARFTCPLSGTYNWMAGAWIGDSAEWTCAASELPAASSP